MLIGASLLVAGGGGALGAEPPNDPRDRRIEELVRTVAELRDAVVKLQGGEPIGSLPAEDEELGELEQSLREFETVSREWRGSWVRKFKLGGYGESHLTFGEGSSREYLDYHRFVLFLGYEFTDGINLRSELEVEHAFVADDAGGELVFEQLHIDFRLFGSALLRFGRFLTPVGIVNQKHEPPSFNGVERPTFAKVIIPSTWSADGLGLAGDLGGGVTYEAYVCAGLDGSGFDATSGIRGGRIKERPSLREPAFTARVDWFPLVDTAASHGQVLRLGASTWMGGLENGNKGKDPAIDANLKLFAFDFEYSISIFDFRGEAAWLSIDGARDIGGGTASAMFGWYIEAAVHLLPEGTRVGDFGRTDLVAFVRYEDLDTQFRMPNGTADDPRGDRREWTVGLTWFIRPNLVFKLDYQFRDDDTDRGLDDFFNVGLGWQF